MAARRVRCPECSVILDLPEEFQETKVRCSVCQAEFRIPGVSDADILDWIGSEAHDDTVHGDSALSDAEKTETVPEGTAAVVASPSAADFPKGFSAGAEGVFLIRVDSRGALFEFPAAMLNDKAFRSALPRRCLRCGATAYLSPRLVIFGPSMKDCTTAEAEFLDQSMQLNEKELRNLSPEEVLNRLPTLSRLPHPLELPMPYWICDLCSPSKMIYAQNELHSDTDERYCRLQLQRLWRAEEFLLATSGKDTEAHRELIDALEAHPETPWDTLAGVVQQRLRQWYAPNRGERFIAYTPDRSHTRTEDGMAGVVVSTRRLIYHTSLRHRESEKGESLELNFAMDANRRTLRIQSPNWEVKNMIVDKAGLACLRRALIQQKFNAVWH